MIPTWAFWSMPLFVGVALFFIAFFVLLRGQSTVYNHVFFALYLASGTKSITEAIAAYLSPNPGSPFYRAAVFVNPVVAYFLIALFLWFVLVFPRPIHPWLTQGKHSALVLLLAVPFLLNQWQGFLDDEQTVNAFNAYVTFATLSAFALLLYHLKETDSDEERNRIKLLAATFGLNVFSTVVVAVLHGLSTDAFARGDTDGFQRYYGYLQTFGLIVAPVLEIAGAGLLTYAILRYQFLGVNTYFKIAFRTTMVTIVLASVFIIISNSVQQFVQETFLSGVSLNFIIAGFISVALMFPVEKAVRRLATRFFPDLDAQAPGVLSARRMEIYEAQLRYAFADGALKPKEVMMLRQLKASLNLEANELTQVLEKFPSLDARIIHGGTDEAHPADSSLDAT